MFLFFNTEFDTFFFFFLVNDFVHFFFLETDLILLSFLFKISCWVNELYKVSSSDSDICMCLMMTKILYFCSSLIIQNQIFRRSSVTYWILTCYKRKTNLFLKIIIASLSQSIFCNTKSFISEKKSWMIKFWKLLII